jgi:hypothetical protein
MILFRKWNNWKSFKITETMYIPFQTLYFWEENSWNQLINWKNIIPVTISVNLKSGLIKGKVLIRGVLYYYSRSTHIPSSGLSKVYHTLNLLRWSAAISFGWYLNNVHPKICAFHLFNAVKPARAFTSVKQSPVFKYHFLLVMS